MDKREIEASRVESALGRRRRSPRPCGGRSLACNDLRSAATAVRAPSAAGGWWVVERESQSHSHSSFGHVVCFRLEQSVHYTAVRKSQLLRRASVWQLQWVASLKSSAVKPDYRQIVPGPQERVRECESSRSLPIAGRFMGVPAACLCAKRGVAALLVTRRVSLYSALFRDGVPLVAGGVLRRVLSLAFKTRDHPSPHTYPRFGHTTPPLLFKICCTSTWNTQRDKRYSLLGIGVRAVSQKGVGTRKLLGLFVTVQWKVAKE